jgi:hypothetical protein
MKLDFRLSLVDRGSYYYKNDEGVSLCANGVFAAFGMRPNKIRFEVKKSNPKKKGFKKIVFDGYCFVINSDKVFGVTDETMTTLRDAGYSNLPLWVKCYALYE